MPVRVDYSARSGGIIRIIFSIFFNMKACCVFSVEFIVCFVNSHS